MKRYRLLSLLLAFDALLILAHIFLRDTFGFFDLDKERSLKATYSGLQLLLSGVAAGLYVWLCARRSGSRTTRWLWAIVAAGFFYLALDEMMTIHERAGFVVNRWVGASGYWGESFNWLIYFSPFIATALVVYFFLIRSLWREEKRIAQFFLAGTLLFAASILLEMIGGKILGHPLYQVEIIVEEASQLIGESFFLAGILLHLRRQFEKMYIRI